MRFRPFILTLIVITQFAACAPKSPPAPREFNGVIATVGPMSGLYATFGTQMSRGAEMAVADINAAGGILGKQLVLEIRDDACDPAKAVRVASQMAENGVSFVAGHFCSGSSVAASSVYEDEGIMMISPASTHPLLTERDYISVFRVCGRDDQQGIIAGDLLADEFGSGKIAILYDSSDSYGKDLAEKAKLQLNRRGVREAMYEPYDAGEKDYSALISRMEAASINAFYIGGYHTEASLMIRQAHERGFTPRLVSADALMTEEFWKIAGPAGQGSLMTFIPDPRKKSQAAPTVKRFRDQGYEPEGYTLLTYAAIQVWAQAVKKAGSAEPKAVADSLRRSSFETILGRLGFDEKGDVTGIETYVWYAWKDGYYDYR